MADARIPHGASRNAAGTAYLMAMRPEELLTSTAAGLCCRPGGFHIDGTPPVVRALISHGHSDHARAGHGAVLATAEWGLVAGLLIIKEKRYAIAA